MLGGASDELLSGQGCGLDLHTDQPNGMGRHGTGTGNRADFMKTTPLYKLLSLLMITDSVLLPLLLPFHPLMKRILFFFIFCSLPFPEL